MRVTYLNVLLVFTTIWLTAGCISQKKYEELRLVKEYYENEADTADSLSGEYRNLYNQLRQQEADLKMAYRDIEQLTATNIGLNNSYQDLLQRYNATIGHNNDVLQTYSYEKQLYDQKLAQQQDLTSRSNTTNTTPSAYSSDAANLQQRLNSANRKISELVQQLAQRDEQIRQLQSRR